MLIANNLKVNIKVNKVLQTSTPFIINNLKVNIIVNAGNITAVGWSRLFLELRMG